MVWVHRLCWGKYRVRHWWPPDVQGAAVLRPAARHAAAFDDCTVWWAGTTFLNGETLGQCGLFGCWHIEHLRHFIALEAKVLPRLAQMTELIPARTSMQYRTRLKCKWHDCVHGPMCVHHHSRPPGVSSRSQRKAIKLIAAPQRHRRIGTNGSGWMDEVCRCPLSIALHRSSCLTVHRCRWVCNAATYDMPQKRREAAGGFVEKRSGTNNNTIG